MLGWLLTAVRGAREAGEGSARPDERQDLLVKAVEDLRDQLKRLQRDVDDLDERFGQFKGRVNKRRQVERDEEQQAPEASPPVHPLVAEVLRRRHGG